MKFARCRHNESGREVQVVVRETALHVIQGDLFEDWRETGEIYPLSEVTLLAPLQPNSIIGIGQNYISAGMERPERLPDIPLFFHKPVSSLIGHEDKIEIPVGLDYLKFECELAVVIGRKGKHIPIKHAPEYIFGYTIGNDVSATQLTHPDGHWMLVKSGDTFTPLGRLY
ncbi:fumarylacetoacetate hydrolase family protein [Paenibacillus sp. TAB 01]|uniref:fumarylacetoacetate hydrolase family protein n=1 Tax=Paenibacillus sp. TAB 01 TaxID=3368988 RepID=UPI0037534904